MHIKTSSILLVTLITSLNASPIYASPAQCLRDWIQVNQRELIGGSVSTYTGKTFPGLWGYRFQAEFPDSNFPFGRAFNTSSGVAYDFTPLGKSLNDRISYCHCTSRGFSYDDQKALVDISGVCAD